MSEYLVAIEAGNLLVTVEGEQDKYGFVRWLLVEAGDATLAAKRALSEVTSDEALYEKIENEECDSPAMTVKDVVQADGSEEAQQVAGTTVWYSMDARES
ncbi:hypothetical protein NG895_26970 [Aeoliella sp. ICT_H6.2]|uniref:Uncharacterized protein n=1 Tax=Aeoliella straminimaris TaxID=2954799 RepID=A0A9X2JK34_9BACT|nr:hypothetical protein [Aeoliella straminimaris]MCO6047563.1 hypothetical protein [Aeoliella straminimaris]